MLENMKILTTERRVNYLVSESNFHTTKFFIEKLLAIRMKKKQNKKKMKKRKKRKVKYVFNV